MKPCLLGLVSCFLVVSSQRCPSGWFAFQDRCFYTDQTPEISTWSQASDICVSMGGTLAIVDNIELNGFLNKFSKERCWIGLSDLDEEGKFVWVDGTVASFTNWGPDDPNDSETNAADCVEMKKTGIWNDKECTASTGGYMCQQDIGPMPTEYNTPTCTPGWILFEDRCFWVDQIEANRTWFSARDECIAMGGTLAIVDTKEVQDFLELFTTEDCYIGLHDFEYENQFYWVDGRTLTSTGYTNWDDDNPSMVNGNVKDCVEMQTDGTWNDKSCTDMSNTDGVMCEKEPEWTTTAAPITVQRKENDDNDGSTWGAVIAVIVFSTLNFVLLSAIIVYAFLQHYRQRDGNINSTGTIFSKGNMSVDLPSGIENKAYNINNGEGFDTKA